MTSKTASWRHPVAGLTSGARTMRHGASRIWATICTATSRIVSGCLASMPTSSLPASQTLTQLCTNGLLTSPETAVCRPLERLGKVSTVQRRYWTGKTHRTDTYRYVNQVPLRNSDDALMVNWCELVTMDAEGDVVFRNAWATSHRITDHNVVALAAAGRARWKIENENNNTLKTKGYHFEHNFGHGKQYLSNLFATMILLAFLVHTTLDWIDAPYRAVRDSLPSRRTFFEHLRALIHYLPFDDWDHLMQFMIKRPNPEPLDTG